MVMKYFAGKSPIPYSPYSVATLLPSSSGMEIVCLSIEFRRGFRGRRLYTSRVRYRLRSVVRGAHLYVRGPRALTSEREAYVAGHAMMVVGCNDQSRMFFVLK